MTKELKQLGVDEKRYEESVQFPVEIVGKDGIVRHYSFEESVHLYRHRMNAAVVRYPAGKTRAFEIQHCVQRIGQLRRSFYSEFGWEGDDPDSVFFKQLGEHCGEIAAFLQRTLAVAGRLQLMLEPVLIEDPHRSLWSVRPWGSGTSFTLTVYSLSDAQQEDPARDAYFSDLRCYKQVGNTRLDEECWVSHYLASDVAMMATVRTADLGTSGIWLYGADRRSEGKQGDWMLALRALDEEQWVDVLCICRALVHAQPMHRRASLLGAYSALRLGRYLRVEELSLVAGLYFPHEQQFQWLRMWAQYKLNRSESLKQNAPFHRDFGVILSVVRRSKSWGLLSATRDLFWRDHSGALESFRSVVLGLLVVQSLQFFSSIALLSGGLYCFTIGVNLVSLAVTALSFILMGCSRWVFFKVLKRFESAIEEHLVSVGLSVLPRA